MDEPAPDDGVETLAQLPEGSESVAQVTAAEAPATPSSGGTLHILTSGENCIDIFTVPCSSTFPAPQCPDAYEGQPCYPATGWTCYQTAWFGTYNEYICY